MKISVVIPTYNRSALLVRTLDSVFAQARPPDEVIVVDDGSTDDTREAVFAYPHLVLYRYQENARPAAARNHGQRVSTGDALVFLDSDDLLLPTALGKLEATLESNPNAALAYCACEFIGDDDQPVPPMEGHPFRAGAVWEPMARGNFIRSPGAALIRRSHLDRVGPSLTRDELFINEDWELFLRLSEDAPFAFLDEPLFRYRVQQGSWGKNARENHRWALVMLEMHMGRNAADPYRLSVLSASYEAYHQETVALWKRAAASDMRSGKWGDALRCLLALARVRSGRAALRRSLTAARRPADSMPVSVVAEEVRPRAN